MEKERMNENCQIPMRNEENENDWHENGLESWEKYRPEQGPKVETGNNIRMNGIKWGAGAKPGGQLCPKKC